MIDFPIERINQFLETHTFEVYLQPTHDEDYRIPTNVKVKLTGVKEYISIGDKKPFIQYTIYILPTDKTSDWWSKMYGDMYGKDVTISTTSQEYANLRWVINEKLSISHETIYKIIRLNKQLGGTLYKNLRQGSHKRRKSYASGKSSKGSIKNRISIDKRPKIVEL